VEGRDGAMTYYRRVSIPARIGGKTVYLPPDGWEVVHLYQLCCGWWSGLLKWVGEGEPDGVEE